MNKLTPARFAALSAIAPLLLWMAVPLALTVYFSFIPYNLPRPDAAGHWDFTLINYEYFLTDDSFWRSLVNTAVLVIAVLLILVALGIGIAAARTPVIPAQAGISYIIRAQRARRYYAPPMLALAKTGGGCCLEIPACAGSGIEV